MVVESDKADMDVESFEDGDYLFCQCLQPIPRTFLRRGKVNSMWLLNRLLCQEHQEFIQKSKTPLPHPLQPAMTPMPASNVF